jgi:integrase
VNKKEKKDLILKLQALADPDRNPNMHEARAAEDKIAELLQQLSPSRKRGDGSVYLRPDSKNYWCCYYLRGEPFRESTRTADEKEAEKYLKARMREVGADLLGARTFVTPKAGKLIIKELVEALKADYQLRGKLSPQNASHLRRVSADFGEVRAVELTAEKIDAYVKTRLAGGDRPASINRSTQVLSQAFRLAIRRGHLTRAPYVRHLSERGNERQGFLEPADFAKLLTALPDDGLRDFCEWAYITGQRKGEVRLLRWSMLHDGELRIPGEICKNGRDRILPITGRLEEILKRRAAARKVVIDGLATMSEYLFHRGDGRCIAEFRKTWARATRSAGLSVLFHDLRRSSVRNAIRAGVLPQVARALSGHRSENVFARYNILVADDLRDALAKTEKYREAEAAKQPQVVSIGR